MGCTEAGWLVACVFQPRCCTLRGLALAEPGDVRCWCDKSRSTSHKSIIFIVDACIGLHNSTS